MEAFAIGLFAVAVLGIPIAILLLNDYGKKRGCGRGCASCGNRFLCHPGQYPQSNDPSPAPKPEDHN